MKKLMIVGIIASLLSGCTTLDILLDEEPEEKEITTVVCPKCGTKITIEESK